ACAHLRDRTAGIPYRAILSAAGNSQKAGTRIDVRDHDGGAGPVYTGQFKVDHLILEHR
ncbi:hypothetical protein J6590_047032, partial [Homalodisca vitripennis]